MNKQAQSQQVESLESLSGTATRRVADRVLSGRFDFSTIALFVAFIFLFALISNLLASKANAQAALGDDPATLAASAADSERKILYNGQLLIETSRTANEADPISYTGWYQATASATHRKAMVTATARLGYTREYSYEREDGSVGSVENPSLTVAKTFLNGKDFGGTVFDAVSVLVSGAVGANAESRRRTFLWSNGIGVMGAKAIGRFNLRQLFGYSRSFFEYDIRDNGVVNSPNTVRSSSILFYSVSDAFSLGANFTYAYAISFQGVGRATTSAQASADYAFTDRISASVGVASERGTLEPDGQTNRIRFFAPEAAQYFVDLIISL